MTGPKMGNTYPGAISSQPNWVAHETPYTAEYGNSVGFEFYLVEYELGIAPRGTYNSVRARLDGLPKYLGFNFFARGYYLQIVPFTVNGVHAVFFEIAEHDADSCFDLVGRRNITAKVSGWYHVVWNIQIVSAAGTYPNTVNFYLTKSGGDIDADFGHDNRILERAGNYSFTANESVYLNAGQYIYAWYMSGSNTLVQIGAYWQCSQVTFTLLDAVPYDRR